MLEAGATACTDITGFGLGGHGHQLAHFSNCALEIDLASLPVIDGAIDAIDRKLIPGGLNANRTFLEPWVSGIPSGDAVPELLYDPQTSGGLLIAIPEADSRRLEDALLSRGVPVHNIGRVVEGRPGSISLR
jgi:selenide,water dikinase